MASFKTKVRYVLLTEGFEISEGETLQEVLDTGGAIIDSCLDPHIAVIQDEDGRWLMVSAECCINPLNPELLREWLEERICDIVSEDTEVSDNPNDELTFLRTELARLAPVSAEEPV